MRHARFTFFICALVIAIAFWPPSAHAVGSTAGSLLSNLFAINVLDLVERVLDLVRDILVTMVNFLGGILQQALALPLNTGGPAVYAVWKLLRDMCNLLFIVAFIAMAFGTIFNVVWKNDYYYSSAIKGVLIAAIGINFSLAIGQTVIWGGNAASKEIIALMPKGIALQIAADLRLADRTSGASTPDIGAIPGADTPNELLSDNERIAVEAWGREGYTRALTVFKDCLKRNESPHACFLKTSLSSSLKEDIVAAASKPTSQEIGESFWDSFLSGSYGKRLFSNAATKELQGGVSGSVLAIQQKLTEILSYIVLLISYLALVVFMFVRVVACGSSFRYQRSPCSLLRYPAKVRSRVGSMVSSRGPFSPRSTYSSSTSDSTS